VSYGTGTRAGFGRPTAGKTGTTDKHADAWFVGYTPDLSTAVWMGYQGGEIPMENVHGIAVSGGSFPAEIWRLYMERTIGLRAARDFPEPKSRPEYKPFQRGPLALSYDPYYVASTDTTGTGTTGTGKTATGTGAAARARDTTTPGSATTKTP
jgi:penicillin-binding protein 1A